jgi:glycosyltransferase involved in cell wall biosynthesis
MVARVRILQVHNHYALRGGEDSIADTEAEILESAGHVVEKVRVENPQRGIGAAKALISSPWSRKQYRRMRRIASDWRPDIAHIHNTWFVLSPSIIRALKAEGIPVVMELQNYRQICVRAQLFRQGRFCTDCVGTHPWRGVMHRCYRESALQSAFVATTISMARAQQTWEEVDRFVAPSEFVKSVFVQAGTAPERIVVKPSVVPDPGPRLEPPSRSHTLLYGGRLSVEKGVDVLIEGWRRGLKAVPDLELEVIGDGPLRRGLERATPPRVRFVGKVSPEQLGQRMLSARVLLFPSQWAETFGRSIVEAMAAALPVLASDIAGPSELSRQLGSGWVVEDLHDPAGWSGALPALQDDARIDAAAVTARRLFEKKYTCEAGLRRLEAVYESIARAPRTR